MFFFFLKQNCQRILRLTSLNSNSDPATLAREVIEKCDIIHKTQLAEVQQIIYYLQKRSESGKNSEINSFEPLELIELIS